MTHYRTADEVRASHLALLGPELGPLYDALYNDVVWVHMRWAQYRLLYGTKPERIDLLNRAAPLFFWIIGDMGFEQTLLDISRLTDPATMGSHQNLSILALPESVSDHELRKTLTALVEVARRKSQFAREWRNRQIAHRDLDLALRRASPLPGASREAVEGALGAIDAVLNAVSGRYLDGETEFKPLGQHGDATQLLLILRDGVRAENSRHERLARGEPNPEDIEPGAPI
jgi:hypothetical protein